MLMPTKLHFPHEARCGQPPGPKGPARPYEGGGELTQGKVLNVIRQESAQRVAARHLGTTGLGDAELSKAHMGGGGESASGRWDFSLFQTQKLAEKKSTEDAGPAGAGIENREGKTKEDRANNPQGAVIKGSRRRNQSITNRSMATKTAEIAYRRRSNY